MSNTIQSSGQYAKKDGSKVGYEFEYPAFDNLQDAVDTLGEAKALKTIQRMTKVDANNVAREKAKVANGDSERKVMSEEDKAIQKAKRAEQKVLLERLMSRPDVLAQLQEEV